MITVSVVLVYATKACDQQLRFDVAKIDRASYYDIRHMLNLHGVNIITGIHYISSRELNITLQNPLTYLPITSQTDILK